ncbi:hypothetical protein IJ579_06725 [bacterium]|nr:hypothetical protein [bacterium]
MEINYFDLSGGINQASTKTDLGSSYKKIYWTDSKNVEIYDNRGIIKQKGNKLLTNLPTQETITGMCEMESDGLYKLIITTESGKIYVYKESTDELILLNKTLTGTNVKFAAFLRGILIATESDEMFYIKDNQNFNIEDCNLQNTAGEAFYPNCIAVFKGRVWCCDKSTLYYSALGTYDDFTTSNDAGYINDFHTDTADIIGMHIYKDYLAVYKKERVYLLSGSSPDDFAILPFADKGSVAANSIINVDNKQYFLSNGIFALEQVGELNQIRLGSEISLNIKAEFEKFNKNKIQNTIALHYQNRNQMWYLFPYENEEYLHTIWINDYVNKAWYKRVLPQNITTAAVFHSHIISADSQGKIYIEDTENTFNGETIDFMWKSPFLSLNDVHHRKLIEEFYFILDDSYDNKFNFSVYKDYDGNYPDDRELIYSKHYDQLLWADENSLDDVCYKWAENDAQIPVWTIGTDVLEKAEICGSCYSVQLCVEGFDSTDNCAIIGLQFREIYKDD